MICVADIPHLNCNKQIVNSQISAVAQLPARDSFISAVKLIITDNE